MGHIGAELYTNYYWLELSRHSSCITRDRTSRSTGTSEKL